MTKIRPSYLHHLLLAIAAFITVLPLILHGCSCGHDFDFHLQNWLEAAKQFHSGNFHPQWTYTPAYNAGEPRFVFYPPISWTIGALLTFIAPLIWVPILFTWLAITLSGSAMYRLARHFAPPSAALLAATLYLANPYMLFTAYERTAYAELLAAACIPPLFLAVFHEKITLPRIAIPIALLWLTDAPAAVMSCYALALLALIRGRDLLRIAAGTLLGLGLAAFYIVPAAYERRYVQIAMAILPGLRIQDNFIFHHTGDPARDAVIHTASFLSILLLALTAAVLITAALYKSTHRAFIAALAILSIAIAVLLTPISLPMWKHLPELAFLQFPWRILALLTTALSLAAALVLKRLPFRPILSGALALTLATTLALPAYHFFRQKCDRTVQSRETLFRSRAGAEPTDEYTPITADNDALSRNNPPFWLSPNPAAAPPANSIPGLAPTHLALTSPSAQNLILNLRDYPAWRITLNGVPIPTRRQRDDGLIALPVPAGVIALTITYATLPDHILGLILTLISIMVLLTPLLHRRYRSVMIKH